VVQTKQSGEKKNDGGGEKICKSGGYQKPPNQSKVRGRRKESAKTTNTWFHVSKGKIASVIKKKNRSRVKKRQEKDSPPRRGKIRRYLEKRRDNNTASNEPNSKKGKNNRKGE